MRHVVPALVLLGVASCGAPPAPVEAAGDAPDPVLVKLRDGLAPDTLRYDNRPAWLAEIARAFTEGRRWKSDGDAFAALVYFAAHAGPEQHPVIESLLADPAPEQRMRGILIVRLSTSPETLDLLQRRAAPLLDPATPQVAKVALGAMSYRRARGATEAILGYYEATDNPAALRALGRIWEGADTDPIRTAVLVVAHKHAMSPACTAESAEAMLRVMTDAELDDFLAKWVPESFAARDFVVAAAAEKGFDRARGKKIHDAFLKSPDEGLVISILWTSPHKLNPAAVNPLLDDERVTKNGGKVCDYAAARLESIETGLAPELPADDGLRERRLKKWRNRR